MKKQVLIVEDESIIAKSIQITLHTLGYGVAAVVASGEAAIAKTEATRPDVVLMDIMLKGGLDGVEAAEQIRLRFDVPVVYLTAYADEKTLQRAKIAEPFGYLIKPFEARELHTTIEMALYRHRMEKKLKESEQRLATILRSIGDGVIATDENGRVTYMNPVAEALTGWRLSEACGKKLSDIYSIIDSNSHEPIEDPVAIGMYDGITGVANDAMIVGKDGFETPIRYSITPMKDEKGRMMGAVLIFGDISDQKRAEKERQHLEAQLQHTQKLESLGVLAGGIAHDFNNLLVSILGNAGLALIELPGESPARQSIEEIDVAAQRAAELTNQLLAYSGKGKFDVKPLQLNHLVEEMSHLLQTFISKKATLKFDFAPDLPAIEADASQIRQVVMNLITNAAEATGDANGLVTMKTGVMIADRQYLSAALLGEALPEGKYVYVEVVDAGCGMDAETVAKIFDPFFTTKFAGRGLGLAAVLGIVRGHRGAIKVNSVAAQGTRVRILFPISTHMDGYDEQRGGSDSKELREWRGKGVVLIVDDEHSVREVTNRMLKHAGFTTLTAKDGGEGVELFREHAAEIVAVLLDLTMPILDGEQALRQIRRISPDVRVILTSGFTEEAAAARFADLGLAGFIQKPYQPDALIKKFREVLEKPS